MLCFSVRVFKNEDKNNDFMFKIDSDSFFPYEHVRNSQKELLVDIFTTIKNKQVLIANAPTGLGKTASALAIAVKHAIENNKKVFFLTNRHTQHRIAIKTLQEIKETHKININCADMIGKKWMCNQEVGGLHGVDFTEYCKASIEKGICDYYKTVKKKNKELTVEAKFVLTQLKDKGPQNNEKIKEFCEDKEMCSYEVSLALAKDAQVLIADYNYMFNSFIRETILKKLDITLDDVILIVDEAHNLPSRATDLLSSKLTTLMLKNALYEAEKFHYNGLKGWLNHLKKVLEDLAVFEGKDQEKLIKKETFMAKIQLVVDYEELIEELENAANEIRKKQKKSYLGGVVGFLEGWPNNDKGFSRIISNEQGSYGKIIKLSHSCLDPSILTKNIFDNVYSSILMSGKLHPTSMYKDLLGIEFSDQKNYASPFPTENKLSIIIPKTTTKFTLRNEEMYKKIANECNVACNYIPGNVAIFFPSYYLRDQVVPFLKIDKKMFLEQQRMAKEDKENLLQEFASVKDTGGILVGVTGANFAEGVDFPGDLLQGVIVVGIPLAKPTLKTKQTIEYYAQKFRKGWEYAYIFPAVNKCMQSAGRCIRSETDKGVVIYLDERFTWKRYFDCFPTEGLIVSENYVKLLEKFYSKLK